MEHKKWFEVKKILHKYNNYWSSTVAEDATLTTVEVTKELPPQIPEKEKLGILC